MKYLICEPSFVGFLSAVYDSYYSGAGADAVTSNRNLPTLIDETADAGESVLKAQKVRAGIIKKGGRGAYESVCDAYRSGNPDKEQIIFDYLRLFFKKGRQVFEMFDNPAVTEFNDTVRKVYGEVHRLIAFVRLQEMSNGAYYGYYSSDNDIIEKLTPDLARRFNTEKFILHDYKRRKMAFYDGQSIGYAVSPERVEIELSERETLFQSLWKQYHENVSIKERENLKLQGRFLPKKYRHFMNEF
jgi:probable DNA metabolism protein